MVVLAKSRETTDGSSDTNRLQTEDLDKVKTLLSIEDSRYRNKVVSLHMHVVLY